MSWGSGEEARCVVSVVEKFEGLGVAVVVCASLGACRSKNGGVLGSGSALS